MEQDFRRMRHRLEPRVGADEFGNAAFREEIAIHRERPFGALASALQGRAHPDRHEMRGFSTAQARAFPGFSAMSQPDSEAASDLIYEVEDGIGRVTFNRPQARNALTFAMYERLAQIC